MNIPFFKLSCTAHELRYVKDVLDSGWLTTGRFASQFEERFKAVVGAKHALAVNSCTAALHLALDALGVQRGQQVFVPTMTFTATAETVRYMGADPILLDVDSHTRCITPEILRQGIKQHPLVRTLMLVHFGGRSADLFGSDTSEGIVDICRDHDICIVHDAAHAFPTKTKGQSIGGIPDITCFSFYANKTLTTGEGGMLTTNDDAIYHRAKLMRLHGIDRDVWDRFVSNKPNWEYDVVAPGFKYNLPDLAAAVGLAQLEKVGANRDARARHAREYFARLETVDEIDLPPADNFDGEQAWHLFPICLNSRAKISRDQVIELMAAQGIGTSVHYKPLHRMKYYRDRYGTGNQDFPNAEAIWQSTLSLPLYPSLKQEEIEYVCDTLKQILASSTSCVAAA